MALIGAAIDAIEVGELFPPERLAQALKFFIATSPAGSSATARTAPPRSRPNAPACATRPAARTTPELVTRTITLHLLKPPTS